MRFALRRMIVRHCVICRFSIGVLIKLYYGFYQLYTHPAAVGTNTGGGAVDAAAAAVAAAAAAAVDAAADAAAPDFAGVASSFISSAFSFALLSIFSISTS